MKKKLHLPFLLSLFLFVILACSSSKHASKTEGEQISMSSEEKRMNQFIDSLIGEMTISEKLGQLNLPSSGDITTGQAKSGNVASMIREGKVGGLFNIKSAEKIHEVQQIAVEESRLGIPLLFGMDVIHGYKTTFPIPLGLSSSWDMDLIQQTARVAANEASADGICWTFSPMTDISKDPRWGRISEGSGEDPYLGSQIAKAMVQGYQGNDLNLPNTILSCVKHFALYGASESGRDYNTVDMSRNRMFNEYMAPYQAAIDAGVGSVMASFNEIDGVPATGNQWLLTDLLRKQWGFEGFVVTDYTGITEMIAHGVGANLDDVSKLAIHAGVDMDMVAEGLLNLQDEVESGEISMQRVNHAVYLILKAKYELGLFDDPYKYCNVERAKTQVFTQENRDFARKVSAESMVLLKNENQVLPLKKDGKIALIGPLANTAVNMAGTWSVATDQQNSIPLLQGLQETVGNSAEILYAKGSNVDSDLEFEQRVTMFGKAIPRDGRSADQLLQEARQIAQQSDVIIAALGETAEFSGESSSVTSLQIPAVQKELLNELLLLGKPVVLVLFTGRPLAIVEENETVPAILNVWFPGSEAGLAISDVLFGDVNPSGKLTATFPRSVGQVPIYYNHKNTGRPLSDEKTNNCEFEKFRSNYLDECNTPLYPFGYGLSYTQFEYSTISLSQNKMTTSDKITATVKVKNTGKYDGKEVVQLYIRDLVGSITRPVKELKQFKKIEIKQGESQTVEFDISIDDLKFYNGNLEYVAEPGDFEVFIGTDSNTTNKVTFTVTK